MKEVTSISELRVARAQLSMPVGFVPTMGYLHEGHLSLVRAARSECTSVVVSIFVNPTQFGPHEDLENYPCNIEDDLKLLKQEGVDLVWTPIEETIYPPDFQTWVSVEEVAKPLEGAMRPSHFRGVATVVAKLFNSVQPQKAYFGQKDAQQAIVMKQMIKDLNFPIEIIICPIVRESDGLAMSSRNSYLNTDERKSATILYQALNAAQQAYLAGERDAGVIRQVMLDEFQQEPLAQVEYVSCAHADNLQELETIKDHALLSVAVYIGQTRLIDNFIV